MERAIRLRLVLWSSHGPRSLRCRDAPRNGAAAELAIARQRGSVQESVDHGRPRHQRGFLGGGRVSRAR
eukprot:1978189-Pyramimonas_sp.AAC.1